MRPWRGVPLVLLLGSVGGLAPPANATDRGEPPAAQDVACQICHTNRAFLSGKGATPARDSTLFVPEARLAETVHGGLPCAACHPGPSQGYPHPSSAALPCETCHTEAGQEWAASIHAEDVAREGEGATCVDCHTPHQVYRADDERAETYPMNVAAMCARCHSDEHIIDEYFTAPEETQARLAVEQYHETVHGTAMSRAGLALSATCNDCHRGHKILPAESPESSVSRAHVDETCEQCHVGIRDRFERSAHGTAGPTVTAAGEVLEPPVCTDCHSSHEIVRADEPAWFIGVVEECGVCHQRVYDTYFETYHGQVTALGFALTAKCSDCHSPHLMLPASDPESTVNPRNLVRTCAQCHPEANANFVRYFAHGDHRDRERFPVLFWTWAFMTTLLVGVWSFFGAHSLLWLARVAIDRIRGRGPHAYRRTGRGPPTKGKGDA